MRGVIKSLLNLPKLPKKKKAPVDDFEELLTLQVMVLINDNCFSSDDVAAKKPCLSTVKSGHAPLHSLHHRIDQMLLRQNQRTRNEKGGPLETSSTSSRYRKRTMQANDFATTFGGTRIQVL
jgi:hypothetical protein